MEYYGKADVAKETTEEKNAKEKLELEALAIDKHTNKGYNENDYINNHLEQQEMVVIENTDIVYVDGWKFEIDRTVPKIKNSLGRGEIEKQIIIDVKTPTINEDYTAAKIKIEISYEKDIAMITLNGKEIAIPSKQEGKYVIEETVEENGKYTILVKDKEEKFNIATVTVNDITEDMDIWNKADMESFRDKVNSGRTFQGRTVRLMDNIDLQGSEANQWIAIGEMERKYYFRGTFEGNYHTIDNLYIKSNRQRYQGLFSIIPATATIQNLIMKNVYVYNDYNICNNPGDGSESGAVVGHTSGKIYNCGIESGEIISKKAKCKNGLLEYARTGGISGISNGIIDCCYNKATIKAEVEYKEDDAAIAGGIACSHGGGRVSNCYNRGEVTTNGPWVYVGGITSYIHEKGKVENCYSIGKITYNSTRKTFAGEITGQVNSGGVQNNNYTGLTTAQKLGIEKWQEDPKDPNGYPILKWQINQK